MFYGQPVRPQHREARVRLLTAALAATAVLGGCSTPPEADLTVAERRTTLVSEQPSTPGTTDVPVVRAAPAPVGATTDVSAADIVIDAPRPGAVVAGPDVEVRGSGTAFEGTLRWRVTSGEAVVTEGFTTAGANGLVGPFDITLTLATGIYTLEVWEPRMSEDGAATGTPPREQSTSRTTFAVTLACTAFS